MVKLALADVPVRTGTGYPPPFDRPLLTRQHQRLADAAGLTRIGVHLVRIPPGGWSSQRHWHSHEDELVFMLEGELVLVTDAGEEILRPGEFAAWKAGVPDGHHLQNRSDRDAVFLVAGNRDPEDIGHYPDVDLATEPNRYAGGRFTRKDGTPPA
ncbi:MAG: cupin domain-containing protein [Geminicoccaceae bacterium]